MPPSSRPIASSSSLMPLLKPPRLLRQRLRLNAKSVIRLRRRPPMLPSPKPRSMKRSKLPKTRPKRATRRHLRRSRRPRLMPRRSRRRAKRKSSSPRRFKRKWTKRTMRSRKIRREPIG